MGIKKLISMLSIAALCIALFSACHDDEPGPNVPDTGIKPNFETKITTSVRGFVTGELNEAIVGATVSAGTSTTQTDENGYFEIENAQLTKDISFILVEKSGYFRGVRTWKGEAGKTELVKVKLLPKTIAASFVNANGGVATTTDGAKLTFPANGVATKAGAAYTGTVNVAMRWLNPVGQNISLEMPGDLRALNADGGMIGLVTYGMLAVELTSDAGEVLQVAAGKTVEMRMPIPAGQQSYAPKDMPLWFFDETKGLWVEEGTSSRVGNEYVGNVKHFSFWNCDRPYTMVYFDAKFTDSKGNPLKGFLVSVVDNSANNSYTYSYTDENGVVNGYVPKNASLTLAVYNSVADRSCQIYSKTFNSGNQNLSLGTISFSDLSNIKETIITGTVRNCEGATVTDGRISYVFAGRQYVANIVNGQYKFTILTCSNVIGNLTINASDIASGKRGSALVSIPLAGASVEAPQISTCQESNFITVVTKGRNYLIPADNMYAYAYDTNESNQTRIYFSGSNYIDNVSSQVFIGLPWVMPKNAQTGTYNIDIDKGAYYGDEEDLETIFVSGTVSIITLVRDENAQPILVRGTFQGEVRTINAGQEGRKTVSGSFYYNGPMARPV